MEENKGYKMRLEIKNNKSGIVTNCKQMRDVFYGTYGGGVNTIAGLIKATKLGIKFDFIVMADPEKPVKNEAAVALGRLGELKGGKARADSLTPERHKEIAQKASEKRWGTSKKD